MAFFLVTGNLSHVVGLKVETYITYSHTRRTDTAEGPTHMLPFMPNGNVHEIIELPDDAVGIVWKTPAGCVISSHQLQMRKLGWVGRTLRMASRVLAAFIDLSANERRTLGLTLRKSLFDLPAAYRAASLPRLTWPVARYAEWVARCGILDKADEESIAQHIVQMPVRPVFHVFVLGQDAAAQASTRASLSEQLYPDYSVQVLDEASIIGELTVPAMEGWLLLLDAGDRLASTALYEFACAILDCTDADAIYSDDDTLSADGQRCQPRFKPDWSLVHLRATNYIGNAIVLRSGTVSRLAEELPANAGSAAYELLLRISESVTARVCHIPAMLLHRTPAALSTPESEDILNMMAVRTHLARCGVAGDVVGTRPACWHVRYALPETLPLISIIVPTRDALGLIKQCVESLLAKTVYPSYEILVVDNQSSDKETLAYLDDINSKPNVRVLRYDWPFNYSAINNFAVRAAQGDVICLLNNDTEVISPNWLQEMLGHLLQKTVGAVGAKLYFQDGRVQHAGDVLGVGGTANHLHSFLGHDDPGYCNRAVVAQGLSAVTAACLLTWKDLYMRLGGLDEKHLPVAFNDVDYCLRVREAGYKVVWTPHAELYHHESVSRGKDKSLLRKLRAKREVRYMRRRWREVMQNDPFYNPNFSYSRPDFVLGWAARAKQKYLTR